MAKRQEQKRAQRAQHITEWEKSGQSKRAYSKSVGINYSTFISWFKSKVRFKSSGKFQKLSASAAPSPSLQIVLPNGVELRTNQGITKELLELLQDV